MVALTSLASARRVVIKIGSALLVDAETGELRHKWLAGLAQDIQMMRVRGQEVLVVSSGSIALGRRVLHLASGDLSLEQSQAAAAVGQIKLAQAYEQALAPLGIITAQVLVTLEDSSNRRRYLNSRATFATLISLRTVPIVNENDTVATDEIRFGDNDRLGAQVALMSGADLLVLLSDVDGLYSANPKRDSAAKHLKLVEKITPEIEAMAGPSINEASSGGMQTKLLAAKTATRAGCGMVIMEGDVMRPLSALENGASATYFAPEGTPQVARKQWISAMKAKGTIMVDAGAVKALGTGKSLLPAGVVSVSGPFLRGDPVEITGPDGAILGKGLAGYENAEAGAIIGRHSKEIAGILGYPGRAALIHRDDMVI